MKTNAAQLIGVQQFRNLTAELGEERSSRSTRSGVGRPDDGHVQVLTLEAGEVLNLTKRFRASRVQVDQGILWITGSPEPEDVLLNAGDSMELLGHGVFVAQGLEDATIRLWH